MKYIKVVDSAEIIPVNEEDIDIPGFVKDDFPVLRTWINCPCSELGLTARAQSLGEKFF